MIIPGDSKGKSERRFLISNKKYWPKQRLWPVFFSSRFRQALVGYMV
jgi:hypothetical protein